MAVGEDRAQILHHSSAPILYRLERLPVGSWSVVEVVEVGALRHGFDTGFRGLASTASTSFARRKPQANRRFDNSLRHFDTASTFLSPTSTHPPLLLEAGASEGSFSSLSGIFIGGRRNRHQ